MAKYLPRWVCIREGVGLLSRPGSHVLVNPPTAASPTSPTPSRAPAPAPAGYDATWAPAANLLLSFAAKNVAVPGRADYDTWWKQQFLASWTSANGEALMHCVAHVSCAAVLQAVDGARSLLLMCAGRPKTLGHSAAKQSPLQRCLRHCSELVHAAAAHFVSAGAWGITKTPKGLVIIGDGSWGSLGSAMDTAFQMLVHAQYTTVAATKTSCINWARGQVNYALGGG